MITDLFAVGDRVKVKIPKESRYWGFNPCPDGTQATILSFPEIDYGRTNNYGHKPGMYSNKSWAKIKLDNGSVIDSISTYHLLLDKKEENKRVKSYNIHDKNTSYVRPLPKTKFWENDIVSIHYKNNPVFESTIHRVLYLENAYEIKVLNNNLLKLAEENLSLVRRGNVWRHFHGKKIFFSSLNDEAEFNLQLGLASEQPNRGGVYSWSMSEALDALKDGRGHALVSRDMKLCFRGYDFCVYKFEDRTLGQKLANYTLAMIGIYDKT